MRASLGLVSLGTLLASLLVLAPSSVRAQPKDTSQLTLNLADLDHAPDEPQLRLAWLDQRILALRDDRPTPRSGLTMMVVGGVCAPVGLVVGVAGLLSAAYPTRSAAADGEERQDPRSKVMMASGGLLLGGGLLAVVIGGLMTADARYRARRHDDAISILRKEREATLRSLDVSINADRNAFTLVWRAPL